MKTKFITFIVSSILLAGFGAFAQQTGQVNLSLLKSYAKKVASEHYHGFINYTDESAVPEKDMLAELHNFRIRAVSTKSIYSKIVEAAILTAKSPDQKAELKKLMQNYFDSIDSFLASTERFAIATGPLAEDTFVDGKGAVNTAVRAAALSIPTVVLGTLTVPQATYYHLFDGLNIRKSALDRAILTILE